MMHTTDPSLSITRTSLFDVPRSTPDEYPSMLALLRRMEELVPPRLESVRRKVEVLPHEVEVIPPRVDFIPHKVERVVLAQLCNCRKTT
ncbi:MAG: hypothetical protein HYR77_00210 [Ignavibacteria bacterium]|nr:hypothetical protein [Ignavibacteria bacterium]